MIIFILPQFHSIASKLFSALYAYQRWAQKHEMYLGNSSPTKLLSRLLQDAASWQSLEFSLKSCEFVYGVSIVIVSTGF